MKSGIYRMRNKFSGEFYIGGSKAMSHRWSVLRSCIRRRTAAKRILRSYRGHGLSAFDFEIIEECAPSKIAKREKHWIKKLKPTLNSPHVALALSGHTRDRYGPLHTIRFQITSEMRQAFDKLCLRKYCDKQAMIRNLLREKLRAEGLLE